LDAESKELKKVIRNGETMKKTKKEVIGFVKSSMVLGVGADISTKIAPASMKSSVGRGFENISKFYPVMGTMAGASTTLRILGKIKTKRRKKRRRR